MIQEDYSMIYSYNKHLYILTSEAVNEELGLELQSFLKQDEEYAFLLNVSKSVYNYIHKHMVNNTPKERAYILSNDNYRETIKDALISELKAIYINKEDYKNKIDGKQTLSNGTIETLGANGLLYRGKYPYITPDTLSGYGTEF